MTDVTLRGYRLVNGAFVKPSNIAPSAPQVYAWTCLYGTSGIEFYSRIEVVIFGMRIVAYHERHQDGGRYVRTWVNLASQHGHSATKLN